MTRPFASLWDEPAIEPFTSLLRRRWEYLPTFDADGLLERFTGSFPWQVDGFVDALCVKSETDAAAIRVDHAGGKAWERDGGALDVLQQLVDLPAPSSPLAPRLVIGSAPRMWTP
ncbi:hypothetical protein ACIRSS_23600 [Amycolatopsis sp. NPDC101161]|uniref:hypothetical protein n=1 Tax=Amycolatopsis sp. NPDC101161 TaxID=3363940 RepID=UPI00380BA3E3